MPRPYNIKQFLAGLFLVVFALSITPKRFVHDVFARHTDKHQSKNNDRPYQLSNAGYNCDNDNLIAESNFESQQQVFSFPVFISFSSFIPQDISYASVLQTYSRLRGPPVSI